MLPGASILLVLYVLLFLLIGFLYSYHLRLLAHNMTTNDSVKQLFANYPINPYYSRHNQLWKSLKSKHLLMKQPTSLISDSQTVAPRPFFGICSRKPKPVSLTKKRRSKNGKRTKIIPQIQQN